MEGILKYWGIACGCGGDQDKEKIEVDGKSFEVNDENFAEKFVELSEKSDQYTSIGARGLQMPKILLFIETCGKYAKEIDLSIKSYLVTSDLVKALNMMPKLEKITLKIPEDVRFYDGKENSAPKLSKIDQTLRLRKLEFLHLRTSNPLIFELFSNFLPENLIVEFHHLTHDGSYKNFDRTLHEAIWKFISRQRWIGKVKTNRKETLKALDLLTLDELTIGEKSYESFKDFDLISMLQNQSQLQALTISDLGEKGCEVLEEICKLSNLESLEILTFESYENFHKVANLKKLKKISFSWDEDNRNSRIFQNFDFQFSSFRSEILEELRLPFVTIKTPEIFENFPNLKVLELRSHQKLNFIAKTLPKLETLIVSYWQHKNFEMLELNTGIVHESLKTLHLAMNLISFTTAEVIYDVIEICPNLEELSIEISNENGSKIVGEISTLEVFKKLNDNENLQRLSLDNISLRHSVDDFGEIAEELKKLARRLEDVQIEFEDRFKSEESEECNNFSYKELVDELEDEFDVKDWEEFEFEEDDEEEGIFRLLISKKENLE